ncbi:mediator of RNA polymerase II transcription subunit 14 isoform X2 [Ctenocephalides felis]|uniref:mediator of RNA polymerase II transcription subunit 14 isoform X2 n=1 Tax=Ctenocephalides felis TaxID=7515 RepID=UPI000E6E2D91|nr:mediator of RNA polymerase II transcription subunit 14 isoform X2 [Ctenocephalides felis]
MTPAPLEGLQTPVLHAPPGQEGARGGSISLAMLIDFIIQRTYHELTVLAELLPQKTDMERKIEIYNFSSRTRQLFVRLLALVKWANSASKVDKSSHIMSFLDKQAMLFIDTADMLARMARETLVTARLPSFHIPAAVEVLTTGTYSRLPSCIKDKIVPPEPITASERHQTLHRLNQVIQHRLVSGSLLPQMRKFKIEAGRVTFHVEHEFEVSLTVMGDGPNIPWRLLDIDILVEDKETGDGKALVHTQQVYYIHQVIQSRLVDNADPLSEVYNCLHYFCQSLQLEVLYTQTLSLCRDRLDDHIHVDEYTPGRCLTISYWRELTSKDPRSELGYRLSIQVDSHDPARPLAVVHVPTLGNKESEVADRAIRSELLSMERLLVHTIYVRTKGRLTELKLELQDLLKDVECHLQGSPAILSMPILQPCLRAEQLLITVDTHTGIMQCHVPQYPQAMHVPELQQALNGDHSRIPGLVSELRYWLTQRRCEKTLQHLPATPHERLPLLHYPDHPMSKISRHRMFVQLHRHPGVILIVEMKEKETCQTEMDFIFHMAVVKHSSIDDDPHDETIETEFPKMYLRVQNLIDFDSFVITHGPFTHVDEQPNAVERTNGLALKRKSGVLFKLDGARRAKQPAYFIPELAHVIALCDERIPFVQLSLELTKNNVAHQGLQVEGQATALVLRILQMPPPQPPLPACATNSTSMDHLFKALLKRLLSVSIRVQLRNLMRIWTVELVFFGSPISSSNPKEQGMRRPVYLQYEMTPSETTHLTVESFLNDWSQIAHLYTIVQEFAEYYKADKYNLQSIMSIKSYTYLKLILGYGLDKGATVTIFWSAETKSFRMIFGTNSTAINAHSIMREQLEAHLNRYRDLTQIARLLHETYEPLVSLGKLPILPQLGVHSQRPQVPVSTFTILPQSPTLIRIAYQGMYCLEVRMSGGGLVSIRDGAYSRYDRSNVVDEFTPTQGLKGFLSRFVDESAVSSRRRSQSEDDNPPSPTVAIESSDATYIGGNRTPHSNAGPGGPQSPREPPGPTLRFHTPQTPPSQQSQTSNPHTPASPHHIQQIQGQVAQNQYSLTSPTGGVMASPSQAQSGPSSLMPASPMNAMQPSPMMLGSPGPNHISNASAHNMDAQHGSPFTSGVTSGSLGQSAAGGMPSPGSAASNWPGSPSGGLAPRPSPRLTGLNSPQPQLMQNEIMKTQHQSRVLPQKSWAGAVPTLITHEALDQLCRPSQHPQALPGPDMAPLERFLGCVYMRRQLQRFIQNEDCLTGIASTEPGVVLFKVESLQCRVGLNQQHLQSLHIKVSPLPDHKDQWTQEELQIIEKFFESRAAVPPYKSNSLSGFGRMLNVPYSVLKDFVQVMRLELMPGLINAQQLKWSVQWALRVPPSAAPLVPVGMAGVMVCRNKILFFLQITRTQYATGVEPASLVLPLVYDVSTNLTQLAEKRDPGPVTALTAASNQFKRFSDSMQFSNPNECSVFPAIRDMLANFVLPNDPPQLINPQIVGVSGSSPSPATSLIHSPMMQNTMGGPS